MIAALHKPARALAALCLMAGFPLTAGALEVTGGFTGWWDQPDQENHGVIVHVSGANSGQKTGAAFWAVFDNEGNPTWFLAQGPIVGDTIEGDLFRVEGPTFLEPFDPASDNVEQVGTMNIQFDSCGSGNVDFNTPQVVVGTGGFRIQRISQSFGTTCSGGVSDDIPPGTLPEEFRTFFDNTGVAPAASGYMDYEQRPDRVDFKVEVEDLPVGDYELVVGGTSRATIEVLDMAGGGTEGEVEFRSPVEPGKLLLDFDPRGQIVDVVQGGSVYLTGQAPDQGTPPGDGGDGDTNPPPFGNGELEVDLVNSGVYPAGSGDAEVEQRSDRVEFDVEIEDVPLGEYSLVVAGEERATIDVVSTPSGPEGEVEFRYPAEPGKILLDFDPLGELIQVFENGTEIFSLEFPSDLGSGSGGGGDDGDDGDDDDGSGGGTTGEFEIGFDNVGPDPDANGEVDYRRRTDRTDFKVEIEDLDAGDYDLNVGGMFITTITVSSGEGEVEFRDPPEPGKLPLDFDPLGQTVTVSQGGTTYLSLVMPTL